MRYTLFLFFSLITFVCFVSSTALSSPPIKEFALSGRILAIEDVPRFEYTAWEMGFSDVSFSTLGVGDFNGDDCDDIIVREHPSGAWRVGISNGRDRFNEEAWTVSDPDFPSDLLVLGHFVENSLITLSGVNQNTREHWTASSNGNNGFIARNWGILPSNEFTLRQRIVGNLNGDRFGDNINLWQTPSNFYVEVILNGSTDLNWSKFNTLYFSEPYPIFSKDLNDDGLDDLLLHKGHRWESIFSNGVSGFGEHRLWASFIAAANWTQALVLDLNGDGLGDILTRSNDSRFWWAAVSNGETGIELQLREQSHPEPEMNQLWAGDFNCDGMDDILARNPNTSSWWLGLSRSSRLLNGVKIALNTGQTTTSDIEGNYHFTTLTSGNYEVSISDPAFAFRHYSKRVDYQGIAIKGINFIGIPKGKLLGVSTNIINQDAGPYICLGYNPNALVTQTNKWEAIDSDCPRGYAFTSTVEPEEGNMDGAEVRVSGSCCRLPASDILMGNEMFVREECPENYIAIGARSSWDDPTLPSELRCAEINTKRYQLGPAQKGVYWGIGGSMWQERDVISKGEIPIAMRYSLGRLKEYAWNADGCLGRPFGSILTAKLGGTCSGFSYRELQYRGVPGDPPKGNPVEMFPECEDLSNPFSPLASCIK